MKFIDLCIDLIYCIHGNIRPRFILTPFVLVINWRILDLAGYTSEIISLFTQMHSRRGEQFACEEGRK